MQSIIINQQDELKRICKSLKVKRLYVFGSAVSGNFRDDSDLDFLISFIDNLPPEEYADNFFSLHYKLRELFNRKVDIITEHTLSNPYLIESINETKSLIYES